MTYTIPRPIPRWTLSGNKVVPKTPGVLETRPATIDEAPTNIWLEAAKQRLREIQALGPGWDDASARPITTRLIDSVLSFISSDLVMSMEVKPDIVPTYDGGILIEWHTRAVDLIIEAGPSGGGSFYLCDNESGNEVEAPLGDQLELVESAFVKLGARR